jgi:hypothetical protein
MKIVRHIDSQYADTTWNIEKLVAWKEADLTFVLPDGSGWCIRQTVWVWHP